MKFSCCFFAIVLFLGSVEAAFDPQTEVNKVFKEIQRNVDLVIKEMENQATEKVNQALSEVKESVTDVVDEVKATAMGVVNEAKTTVEENIKNVTSEIETFAKEGATKLIEEMKEKALNYAKKMVKKYLKKIKKIIFNKKVRKLTWGIYTKTHNMCPGLKAYTDVAKDVAEFLGVDVAGILDVIHGKKNIQELLDHMAKNGGFSDKIENLEDAAKNKTSDLVHGVQDKATAEANKVKDGLKNKLPLPLDL